MVTLIQSSDTITQIGPIFSLIEQIQVVGPVTSNSISQFSSPFSLTQIVTTSGFSSFDRIIQSTVVSGSTTLLQENIFLTTEFKELIFLSTFSGSTAFFGVLGTSGTVEKFFDSSSFFFTPSETDPNTLRNLTELEKFLLFSNFNLSSHENVRNTPSSTVLITTKGDDFSEFSLASKNVITNGGFESDFLSWITVKDDPVDIVSIVTTQPIGVGFDDNNPVVPVDGSNMLYLEKTTTTSGIIFFEQTIRLEKLHSEQLRNFQFSIVANTFSTTGVNLIVAVSFFLNGQRQTELGYSFPSLPFPSPLPKELDFPPFIISLTPLIADIFNTFTRDLRKDMFFATFNFDEIRISIVLDATTTIGEFLFDQFILTIDTPPENLKVTKSISSINTNAPVTSGVPFTISGSRGINQIDLTGPFIDETFPVSGTTFNVSNTQVKFHIKDSGSPLDQSTIDMFIDGLAVVTFGTVTTGTLWPIISKTVITPGDIRYIFTRSKDFIQQSVVIVSGTFADFATPPNLTNDFYQFTILGSGSLGVTITGSPDAIPPVITLIEPLNNDTQVSPDTDIIWSTADNASGVDVNTIKLILNSQTKIDGTVITDGSLIQTTNSNLGFDDIYTPNQSFLFGSTVTGTIQAQDNAGNTNSLTYEFTITPDNTLSIKNFFLLQNESILLLSETELSLSIEDLTHGVNTSGTTFTLNGTTPSSLLITQSGIPSGGIGPARLDFSVLLEPFIDFRRDIIIFVHAENNFPGNFPVIIEQQFVLRPGYSVNWPNKTLDKQGGAEIIFPFITNVPVLIDVKNFGLNFQESSVFFDFLTESQIFKDLGANLISNIKVVDLGATLTSLNPHFVFGKTVTLSLEIDDFQGNKLKFTHTFTIESKPI